jgi:tetratricopeptide (TPR) repeat protein
MRAAMALVFLAVSWPVAAMQNGSTYRGVDPTARDDSLKKNVSLEPDLSLAGDLTRPPTSTAFGVPAPSYQDVFTRSVTSQVASKRKEQIADLRKIIALTRPDSAEAADLAFQLGELYWEESRRSFFEAHRKDDDRIAALNRGDSVAEGKAIRESEVLMAESKRQAALAVEQYVSIVQSHREFARTDEVLYFLGRNLLDAGQEREAMIAFNRLIEKFPTSKFAPDAYLARGEFYFEASKGKHELLEKALEAYEGAAKDPSRQLYEYALYKQGWCYFNLGQYHRAMDKFREVAIAGRSGEP